jgi:hypothetical protein
LAGVRTFKVGFASLLLQEGLIVYGVQKNSWSLPFGASVCTKNRQKWTRGKESYSPSKLGQESFLQKILNSSARSPIFKPLKKKSLNNITPLPLELQDDLLSLRRHLYNI